MHIDYLPNELLQEIFLHVCQSEGDPAILKLGLVCHRWERLFRDDIFRRRVHFSWLSTVYDWEKASDELKSTYYVMYDIRECLECRRKYKDVPGFMGIGRSALTEILLEFCGYRSPWVLFRVLRYKLGHICTPV